MNQPTLLLLSICYVVQSSLITDITNDVELNIDGVVAAYGDFNADKATDVFVVTNQWQQLELYTWNSKKLHFSNYTTATLYVGPDTIEGVAVTDFNGDGYMDVLLSTKKSDQKGVIFIEVYYGDTNKLVKGNLKAKMKDQPTVMDVNGDLYPDLFGTNENDVRSYWIFVPASGSSEANFHVRIQSSNTGTPVPTLSIPNCNGFLDITGDFSPDLLVKSSVSGDNNQLMLETWEQKQTNDDYNFTLTDSLVLSIPGIKVYGMISYVDVDSDNNMEVILPACMTADCSESLLYMQHTTNGKFNTGNWTVLVSNANGDWKFPVNKSPEPRIPFTLRYADLNMDGKIDATAILRKKKGDTPFAAYLINKPCNDLEQSGCGGARGFEVEEIFPGHDKPIENPVSISFLDVYENGGIDFIVTCQNKAAKTKFFTKVLRNDFNVENAFLKVAVLSGLQKTTKYGAVQVGATAGIDTENTDGHNMVGKQVQLSQSAYFALQLPYVVFGLGKSPNFVEELTVGIPKGKTNVNRVKSWTAIIPNAQVIVIPHPKDKPSEWVVKLLVTPSKLLLQTGGVLIGTCLLIAGIILILHIKEKKEDEKEKRKEAHKFHFDAL